MTAARRNGQNSGEFCYAQLQRLQHLPRWWRRQASGTRPDPPQREGTRALKKKNGFSRWVPAELQAELESQLQVDEEVIAYFTPDLDQLQARIDQLVEQTRRQA